MPGIQRLRCYPLEKTKHFAGRTFHGKNQCDIVALVPAELGLDDFIYSDSRSNPVDIARLQLMFDFTILPDPTLAEMEPEPVEAVFVQRLAPFADSRGAPLYHHDGKGKDREGKMAKHVLII